MSHYGKCKHGVYLGGCRKCFPLPKLTKVGGEIIQELVECFNNKDREMKKLFECNCKEELRELKNRIDFLAHQTTYYTDDYWHFMQDRPSTPLRDVVRKIANHLGMQVHIQPAKEETYIAEFKKVSDK